MMSFLETNRVVVQANLRAVTLWFSFLLIAVSLLQMLTGTPVVNASDSLRTVVLTGDAAPVPNENAVFGELFNRGVFGSPVINSRGQTAFEAEIAIEVDTSFGSRFEHVGSIIRENDVNDLALVVIEDSPVPGTNGSDTFRSLLGQPVLNGNGQAAFESTFNGIFLDNNGILQPIVQAGSPTPIPGKVLNVFSHKPTLNDRGQTAFRSGIFEPGATSSTDIGIFISEPSNGELMLIARTGDAVPIPGGNVNLSSPLQPAGGHPLNNSGQVGFSAFLTGSGVDTSNNSAIFRGDSGGLKLIAREGDLAPVPGANLSFANVAQVPTLNNHGHLAFTAVLSGVGVDFTNDGAIFSEGIGEGLALVAREGNPAPVPGVEVNFGRFFGRLINKQGELVFKAALTGEDVDDTNDEAFFRQNAEGSVELIVRRGDSAPVPESGVNYGRQFTSDFRDFAINGRGQIALFTALSDGTTAILAEDTMGQLQVIARTGDLLDVSDDPLAQDFREIRSLEFTDGSGNEDGRRSAFNDFGQLAFSARFTDDTQGIFVSNLVAVPEPSSWFLQAIAGLLGFGFKRRH